MRLKHHQKQISNSLIHHFTMNSVNTKITNMVYRRRRMRWMVVEKSVPDKKNNIIVRKW